MTGCAKACAFQTWFDYFDDFGTHFISSLHLGGKMTTEVCWASTLSLQHSHFNTLTSTLSLHHSHFDTLTPTLSLQHSHSNTFTSTLSLQHSHFNTFTSTLSLQHSHFKTLTSTLSHFNTLIWTLYFNTLTSTLSLQHSHLNKFTSTLYFDTLTSSLRWFSIPMPQRRLKGVVRTSLLVFSSPWVWLRERELLRLAETTSPNPY